MFSKIFLVASIGVILGLTGCGGSGGTTSTDITPPVITLTGDSLLVIPLGGVYSEVGAIANDDIDGEFSATPAGVVDTSTAGNYTITYSAVDNAGNNAIQITRLVKVEPPSDIGSENFQVINGKLVMKATATSASEYLNVSTYGIFYTGEGEDNILGKSTSKFISLEGDVNLLEAQTTGDARSRMKLVVSLQSESTPDVYTRFSLLFDQRTSEIVSSRAYMYSSTSGEVSISGIHKLQLVKGIPVKFKVELLNNNTDFAKLSIGDKSAIIARSDLPASDMRFSQAYFEADIRNDQEGTGDFVKGNIDNIVLKYEDNGTNKTYTQNFDGYRDGRKPKEDTIFDVVFTGSIYDMFD